MCHVYSSSHLTLRQFVCIGLFLCFDQNPICFPRQRVGANFSFFTTNYLMICATCSAVYILRSPGLLLTLLVSMCMFLYVFMSRRKTLVVMDVTLGTREKTIAAAAGTCLYGRKRFGQKTKKRQGNPPTRTPAADPTTFPTFVTVCPCCRDIRLERRSRIPLLTHTPFPDSDLSTREAYSRENYAVHP